MFDGRLHVAAVALGSGRFAAEQGALSLAAGARMEAGPLWGAGAGPWICTRNTRTHARVSSDARDPRPHEVPERHNIERLFRATSRYTVHIFKKSSQPLVLI